MDIQKDKYIYLTTTKKDYVKKPIKLLPKNLKRQEFVDPISEGFRKYLLFDQKDATPPDEDQELYLEKLRAKNEKIAKKHLKEPINKEIILREKITKGLVSEYQTNYCNMEKEIAVQLSKDKMEHLLPDDTDIPLTTYNIYYREPPIRILQEMIRPRHSTLTNEKFLSITESEYMDHISKLGGRIVEGNMKRRLKQKEKKETNNDTN